MPSGTGGDSHTGHALAGSMPLPMQRPCTRLPCTLPQALAWPRSGRCGPEGPGGEGHHRCCSRDGPARRGWSSGAAIWFIYLAVRLINRNDEREWRQTIFPQPTQESRCAWKTSKTLRSASDCWKAKVPHGKQDETQSIYLAARPVHVNDDQERGTTISSGITSQEISLRLEEQMDGKVGKDLSRDEGTKRPAGQEQFIYPAAAAEIRVCDDREGRQSVAAQPTKDSRCAWKTSKTLRSGRDCRKGKAPNVKQEKI